MEVSDTIHVTLMIGVDSANYHDYSVTEHTFYSPILEDGCTQWHLEAESKYLSLEDILKATVGLHWLQMAKPQDYRKKILPNSKLMTFYEELVIPMLEKK
jgi:hypothetical protein